MKNIFKIHHKDARCISELIKTSIVDVTITSPPYYNMKDYGYQEQIGFGQSYDEYINDLFTVFSNVYKCTKDTGTLWVIIDAFRKDGQVIPLPFDFANKISKCGWLFKEVIIWEKDKTVPWAHKGQMRNLFEYILVFSKTNNYKFNIDNVREYTGLKKWWVKYPERYNPKGKTPEAIWRFPIPVQGSWGDNYIRHFCPLPEDLIAQILHITTDEGDVVLDPFAGSGSVLAKAKNMKRQYIGTELNQEYIEMFRTYIDDTNDAKQRQYEQEKILYANQSAFERLIIDLRILKFARVLYSKLDVTSQNNIIRIFVENNNQQLLRTNSVASAKYTIHIKDKSTEEKLLEDINSVVGKAPLSKFGIEPKFIINDAIKSKNKKIATYTKTSTHKYHRLVNWQKDTLAPTEIIISPIIADLNENDFE